MMSPAKTCNSHCICYIVVFICSTIHWLAVVPYLLLSMNPFYMLGPTSQPQVKGPFSQHILFYPSKSGFTPIMQSFNTSAHNCAPITPLKGTLLRITFCYFFPNESLSQFYRMGGVEENLGFCFPNTCQRHATKYLCHSRRDYKTEVVATSPWTTPLYPCGNAIHVSNRYTIRVVNPHAGSE